MRANKNIHEKIIPYVMLFLIAFGIGGCALLIGKPDEGDLPDPSRPVRIRYVETLRNEASFLTERYRQSDPLAPAATSLQKPVSVSADQFRVYVVDRSPVPRLFIFDRNERSVKIISSPTPTVAVNASFMDPSAVAVAEAGDIYVADPPQGKIFGLDRAGNLVFTLGKTGSLAYPAAMAVDSRRHRLYVADKHAHKVLMYTNQRDWASIETRGNQTKTGVIQSPANPCYSSDAAGAFTTYQRVCDLGDQGTKDGLRSPVGLALDSAGNLFVLDAHRNRVHMFDSEGIFVRRFSLIADLAHPLNNPTGIAIDSDGHVYVSDGVANTILIFDQNGMYLQRWGGIGDQRDGFWSPAGIFIDNRDYLYVPDQMNGRVQVFQYEK
ncbi:MAG: hypothetical protein OEW15_11275 [Nitrospirota bacterium]|nr:hypothetical protein [Nitrospirota bacterium]